MELLKRTIYECGLGVSINNALLPLGVESVGDLLKHSEKELSKVRHLGKVGIKKIKFFMDSHGLKLKA